MYDQGVQRPLSSNLIIGSISISPNLFFCSKVFCRVKTREVDCYLKLVQIDGYYFLVM